MYLFVLMLRLKKYKVHTIARNKRVNSFWNCPLGLYGMWKASLQFIEANHEREDAFGIALAYTYAGNKDSALTSLDRAYEERSFGIAWLAVDPAYDSLRSDPRFPAHLRRMRFPHNR